MAKNVLNKSLDEIKAESMSFVLYKSYKEDYFDKLSDEKAGKLIKCIFYYERFHELPPDVDEITEIIFERIKNDIEFNSEGWAITVKNRALAGHKHSGNQYTRRKTELEKLEKDIKEHDKKIETESCENETKWNTVPNSSKNGTQFQSVPKNGTNGTVNENDNVNEFKDIGSERTSSSAADISSRECDIYYSDDFVPLKEEEVVEEAINDTYNTEDLVSSLESSFLLQQQKLNNNISRHFSSPEEAFDAEILPAV